MRSRGSFRSPKTEVNIGLRSVKDSGGRGRGRSEIVESPTRCRGLPRGADLKQGMSDQRYSEIVGSRRTIIDRTRDRELA